MISDRLRTQLLVSLALLLATLLACRQLASADLGFHLKTGEYILGGHGWPHTDPFTTTMKDHPYIDTSWGFDVLVALANRLGGPIGIGLLTIGLVLALMGLLAARVRLDPKRDGTALGLGLLFATLAMEMRFEPRPELASYLFLALQLLLLDRRAAGRWAPAWFFVVVQFAWANVHSLFVLGWIVLALAVVGRFLESRRFDRGLALAVVASIAVSFLNPYGFDGVRFPFTLLTRFQNDNPFAGSIGEFVSPFSLKLGEQFPFYPRWPIWTFRLLVVLTIPALLIWARTRRLTALLVTLALAPLALKMIRNMPLFVIAAVPPLVAAFPVGRWLERRSGSGLVRGAPAVAGILLAAILSRLVSHDAYYIETRRPDRFGFGWNRFALPVEAAAFANRTHLPGAMLNHLNFGGYLMWATPGPVFIDGRLEVVGESFYNDYQRILGSEVALEQAVVRHDIGWLIVPYPITPDLIRRVSADPRWRLLHVDNVAAIFVRADRPDVRDRVDSLVDPALAAEMADGPPSVPWNRLPGMGGGPRLSGALRWLDGLAHPQRFPSDDFYIGLFHYLRKELDPAARRFTAAIVSSRGAWYDAYANLGAVLWRQGNKEGTNAAYKVVLEEDPENKFAWERITWSGQGGGAH